MPTPTRPSLSDPKALAAGVLKRDIRSAARLMRLIDDGDPRSREALRLLYPHTGRAHIIGLTGNPGAGKSTLATALVRRWRELGRQVGVVAIDPSSPFSGGAILGDRIRMSEHAIDNDVFIRSVATRGSLGGLSRSTHEIVMVMDAMGYDPILVETVGVGQDEVDIVRVAHSTAVVMVPGMGDAIQAIKAGILEIADLFVLNKADREGAHHVEKDLKMMQTLGGMDPRPVDIPIIRTVATENTGIHRLVDALDAHRASLADDPARRHARDTLRTRYILDALIRPRLTALIDARLQAEPTILDAVARHSEDPWTIADRLLADILS